MCGLQRHGLGVSHSRPRPRHARAQGRLSPRDLIVVRDVDVTFKADNISAKVMQSRLAFFTKVDTPRIAINTLSEGDASDDDDGAGTGTAHTPADIKVMRWGNIASSSKAADDAAQELEASFITWKWPVAGIIVRN